MSKFRKVSAYLGVLCLTFQHGGIERVTRGLQKFTIAGHETDKSLKKVSKHSTVWEIVYNLCKFKPTPNIPSSVNPGHSP